MAAAGTNYFRWKDGRLVYTVAGGRDRSASPTARQWADLWRLCDEVDLWAWPSEVGDPRVIDGLMYKIDIKVGVRSVKSAGQLSGSAPGFAERVMRVHRGLQGLLGSSPTGG